MIPGITADAINIVGTIIFAGNTVYAMPKLIAQWLCVKRVYGRIPWTLARDMWHYIFKTYNAYMAYMLLISIIVSVSMLFSMILRGDLPQTAILLNLAALVWALQKTALMVVPPTVLLLGTSNEDIYLNIKELRKLSHCRTVTLIHPLAEFEVSFFRQLFFYNYFRTTTRYQWRSIVFHLMDVVPVIVFDAKSDTVFVDEEKKRIERCNYLYKTLFVTSSLDNSDHHQDKAARSVERSALADNIQQYLKILDDTGVRTSRQADFNTMLKAVPKKIRYPGSEYGLIIKAQILAAYGRQQFLHVCKGIRPGEDPGGLIEDIPSVVSHDEGLRYLNENRALEEAELVLTSVQEELIKAPDENNCLNLGNVCNKRSQIQRLRGEWEKAISLSEEAMKNLARMLSEPLRKDQAQREIATSHYIMGEILMARFRKLKAPEDRSKAIYHFNRSILYDREVNGDTHPAEKRLRELSRQS